MRMQSKVSAMGHPWHLKCFTGQLATHHSLIYYFNVETNEIDHFVMYTNIESLHCISETNNVMSVVPQFF